MTQPKELKLNLPMEVGNGTISTTTDVWQILSASDEGNLDKVKSLAEECHDLLYAQYNYAPPIHFAVRSGHLEVVRYLLDNGAHDPDYRFYPFRESMQTVANDRGFDDIEKLLNDYAGNVNKQKYRGDTGEIYYNRTELEKEFERAVGANDLKKTENILKQHPEFALDETYCWSEGILLFPAKNNHRAMIDLLMDYGARVPHELKWTQFYYFERLDAATYLMEKGMDPNTISWQRVTILHDMAQKGFLRKAELLLKYGADINPIDDAYLSTPLGLASRWGQVEMVKLLLDHGADPNRAGAPWATPLSWAKKYGHSEIAEILI